MKGAGTPTKPSPAGGGSSGFSAMVPYGSTARASDERSAAPMMTAICARCAFLVENMMTLSPAAIHLISTMRGFFVVGVGVGGAVGVVLGGGGVRVLPGRVVARGGAL